MIRIDHLRRFSIAGLFLALISFPGRADLQRQISAAPGGKIVVEMGAGSLSVEGWARPDIEVITSSTQVEDSLTISRNGEQVLFTLKNPQNRRAPAGELRLKVPRFSNCRAVTTSAGVSINNLSGDVDIRTDAGNVDFLANMPTGHTKIATLAGAIIVKAETRTLEIDTVSGSVEIHGKNLITVSTISGSVQVDGESQGAGTIRTVSGRVDFRGQLRPGTELQVSSHTGDVALNLLRSDPVRFSLSTFGGRITNNGKVVHSEERGQAISLGAHTKAEGQPRVEIGTFSGAISLRYPKVHR